MSDRAAMLYCSKCLNTFQEQLEACPNLGCNEPRPESGWGQMYEPGDIIDRTYRVSRRLALGGAGVTYLVRSIEEGGEETGPWIALKLLFASRDSGAYLRRLATEAQILQQLHHPNIVEYLGFVHRTGQSPYLMTQFEEGGSLLDHMKRVGTMSVREAADVGRQVCLALEKGHAQGITHRDLKPENLLLREITPKDEAPKIRVADFGIAKVTGSIGGGLTRVGAFVGTPQYAAPEQFLGEPATDKSDVYAVGAVMVFMMTARPIVDDAHNLAAEDVYSQLVDVLPPGISRKSDTPEACAQINAILARAMTIEPEQRCTVSQLSNLLGEFLDTGDSGDVLLDGTNTGAVEDSSYAQMATIQAGMAAGAVDAKTAPTPTIKDPDGERGALRFAADIEEADTSGSAAVEAVAHDPGSTAPAPAPAPIKSSANDGHPLPSAPSRSGWTVLIWLLLFSVLSSGAAAGVYLLDPGALDGLSSRGGVPVDGITVRSAGNHGRRAGINVWVRDRKSLIDACPESKGKPMEIEFVVNIDGTIRWARPLDWRDRVAWCVSFELEGRDSNYELKEPSKVRLTVQP